MKKKSSTLHLLMRIHYHHLLKIAKEEEIEYPGRKKRQVAKAIADALPPKKVRAYFAEEMGVSPSLLEHEMVPDHEIMSKKEEKELLDKFRCKKNDLPKIKDTDPAVLAVRAKPGDVLRITRNSHTAGESTYYRLVVKHVT